MTDANFVPPPKDSPQAFLNRLVEFLGEEDFEDSLTTFLHENASKIEFTTREEEQKLETYTIYQNYLALVESKMDSFAAKEGCTPEQFQQAVNTAKNTDSSAHSFVNALIASWDFDIFMTLVQEFLQEQLESDVVVEGEDDEDDGHKLPEEEIDI